MKANTQNRAKAAPKSSHLRSPSRLTSGRPISGGGAWQNRTTFGRGLRRMARLSDELGRAGPVPCGFLAAGLFGTNWARGGLIWGCGWAVVGPVGSGPSGVWHLQLGSGHWLGVARLVWGEVVLGCWVPDSRARCLLCRCFAPPRSLARSGPGGWLRRDRVWPDRSVGSMQAAVCGDDAIDGPLDYWRLSR
jgi:hypothetical protein